MPGERFDIGHKKEEKEASLLLFRDCTNSVVNNNIEEHYRHKCKSPIIPLFESEIFECNGAFLYRPTLNLLGLWLLI
jgi:hypothetical protein